MLEDISTAVAQLRNKPATALVSNVNILCIVYGYMYIVTGPI